MAPSFLPSFLPSRSPCTPPTPQGILRVIFLFLSTKLRNLLHPWGPCPYHLPPQNRSPWTSAPTLPLLWNCHPAPTLGLLPTLETSRIRHKAKFAPLQRLVRNVKNRNLYHLHPQHRSPRAPTSYAPVYPPVHQASSGGYPTLVTVPACREPNHLPSRNRSPWTPPEPFSFCTLKTSKIRRKLRNLLRPWCRAPTTYPPGSPPLHCNSQPSPNPPPSLELPSSPCPPTEPKPLDLPPRALVTPPHRASKTPFSSFCTRVAKFAPTPPVHQASSRAYPPPTPQGILQKTPFFFFLYALETSKIRPAGSTPHTPQDILQKTT